MRVLMFGLLVVFALPGCAPERSSNDDDSAVGDDDDSTPLATCPDEDDALEEDDWPGDATAVDTGWSEAAMACPDDADVYVLEIPNCATRTFDVWSPEVRRLELDLMTGDSQSLGLTASPTGVDTEGYTVDGHTWTEPTSSQPEPPDPKIRFLSITAPSDEFSGGVAYRLEIGNEPNYNCDE